MMFAITFGNSVVRILLHDSRGKPLVFLTQECARKYIVSKFGADPYFKLDVWRCSFDVILWRG